MLRSSIASKPKVLILPMYVPSYGGTHNLQANLPLATENEQDSNEPWVQTTTLRLFRDATVPALLAPSWPHAKGFASRSQQ
jgi:hypothetical protein